MTPEELRLQCLSLVVSKMPSDFDPAQAIAKAEMLLTFILPDNPPKRGPGRPRKEEAPTSSDKL
jgi:hypothetical protein